jgi:phospholipid/cholesterol/gamma-HCH transport system ATP-binding protein
MSIVSVRNLVYEIPGKRIVDDVSLDIETGEIVSIMGPSGSGKTTLLKLMTGLLKPTSGQILIDGTDIARMDERGLVEIHLKLGLVFQYAALFDSLNVYDNIVFGLVRHKKMDRSSLDAVVAKLLADVELSGIEKRMPSELSGGMQKRVGLARALALEPSIVFYDEPTSGLDPLTAGTIDELIINTRRRLNVTSVVVSHHLASIFRFSDRIAMLHRGRITAIGTPDELKASQEPAVRKFLEPERGLANVLGS